MYKATQSDAGNDSSNSKKDDKKKSDSGDDVTDVDFEEVKDDK